MKKNSLMKYGESIIRILEINEESILFIDCIKKTMPQKTTFVTLTNYEECNENELLCYTNTQLPDIELLDKNSKRIIHERFTMIAGVLPFISDIQLRNYAISNISTNYQISKQTIRRYLCLYLVYQNITILSPKKAIEETELTQDQKNMRWALNKFFYTKNKNSIATAYTMMLKEKYCDKSGILLPEYPSIHQFRYFEKKHRKAQNYFISRDGIKDYQRNNRPLLGDGIQEFAPNIGTGMLDATICDIYLVNESGNLIGRPILTACIDAYSSLCCGYSLSWEGGVYSLRGLMLNIISDKVKWCKQFGIAIEKHDWNCNMLPAILVTDMGSEYKSENFELITELGVTLINLPAYRPELKGAVEKFFDLIQNSFKPYLKGKGVIEPDYQERGAHDYRKDACLTMVDFEKIILRCIIYYNSKRIIENFPYTKEMIESKIQPYASNIWEWGMLQSEANLIETTDQELVLTLLPRTTGKFCRNGLIVNKLRYKHENYKEMYLKGGTVAVAYNPDDVSNVWLIENGYFIRFELIESRYRDRTLSDVENIQSESKNIVKAVINENTQAQIDLANYIESIASSVIGHENTNIKGIRENRQKEQSKTHINYIEKAGIINE